MKKIAAKIRKALDAMESKDDTYGFRVVEAQELVGLAMELERAIRRDRTTKLYDVAVEALGEEPLIEKLKTVVKEEANAD